MLKLALFIAAALAGGALTVAGILQKIVDNSDSDATAITFSTWTTYVGGFGCLMIALFLLLTLCAALNAGGRLVRKGHN